MFLVVSPYVMVCSAPWSANNGSSGMTDATPASTTRHEKSTTAQTNKNFVDGTEKVGFVSFSATRISLANLSLVHVNNLHMPKTEHGMNGQRTMPALYMFHNVLPTVEVAHLSFAALREMMKAIESRHFVFSPIFTQSPMRAL